MKHTLSLEGFSYYLSPITIEDASFIVETRLEDKERNKYINTISSDVKMQEEWIERYFNIPNDYYFVVKNKFTYQKEGLISIYNINNNKAEWGRWVIRKDSNAAIESFYLICCVAFELLSLDEIYSITIVDNIRVIAFHDSINAERRRLIPEYVTIDNNVYDCVEHFITKEHFLAISKPKLNNLISLVSKNET
jgi:RimJ/RimL family protein N-acetyltransferase